MPTLNQPLGSFSTESRAANFPQCRQECPLLPPINTGGFQGLKRKKIGSKVSQKISLFPVPATFSMCVCVCARACASSQQPTAATNTLITSLTTTLSTTLSLSTNCFSLFLHSSSSPSTPSFSFSSFSSTCSNNISTDLHRHHQLDHHHLNQPSSSPAAKQPLWSPLSLLCNFLFLLSPSPHNQRRPPSFPPKPPKPPAKHPHHVHNPTLDNFLLPVSPPSSSSRLLHATAD